MYSIPSILNSFFAFNIEFEMCEMDSFVYIKARYCNKVFLTSPMLCDYNNLIFIASKLNMWKCKSKFLKMTDCGILFYEIFGIVSAKQGFKRLACYFGFIFLLLSSALLYLVSN